MYVNIIIFRKIRINPLIFSASNQNLRYCTKKWWKTDRKPHPYPRNPYRNLKSEDYELKIMTRNLKKIVRSWIRLQVRSGRVGGGGGGRGCRVFLHNHVLVLIVSSFYLQASCCAVRRLGFLRGCFIFAKNYIHPIRNTANLHGRFWKNEARICATSYSFFWHKINQRVFENV
jgi:hypothetical protein